MPAPALESFDFFTQDHQHCDALWSAVESAADAGDAGACAAAWAAFESATRRHFAMEEEVLFPALEAGMGMPQGPTQVMRMEHGQMRSVLDTMARHARDGDYEQLVDQGDTLLMLVQQHNAKEEAVLYPMAAQQLAADWPELARKLRRYLEP